MCAPSWGIASACGQTALGRIFVESNKASFSAGFTVVSSAGTGIPVTMVKWGSAAGKEPKLNW
jgi:hypothetical protein